MADELVERLREGVIAIGSGPGMDTIYAIVPANQAMRAAAARIESLTAQLAEARAEGWREGVEAAAKCAEGWVPAGIDPRDYSIDEAGPHIAEAIRNLKGSAE